MRRPPASYALQPAQGTASAPQAAEHDLPEVERRQLTVLACRLSALQRAEPLDPEVLCEVVRDYHAMCTKVVHRFDGHIAQDQGDKLVVYFGYPRAHEDDARRAVHTALGMVESIASPTACRATGACGWRCAWDSHGPGGRGRHGTRSPKRTARPGQHPDHCRPAQDLAEPDTVLISPATLRLVEGYFDCRALGAHVFGEGAAPLASIRSSRRVPSRAGSRSQSPKA